MLLSLLLIACGSTTDTGGKDTSGGTDWTGGDATAGATVFADHCAACHGADGTGGSGPSLAGTNMKDDSEVVGVIQNGVGDMPAQGLTDAQTKDVLAWLRSTFP